MCQKASSNLHDTHRDTSVVHIIEDFAKKWTDLKTDTQKLYDDVSAKYKPHEQLILGYESQRAALQPQNHPRNS